MNDDLQTITLLGKSFHIKHPIEEHANLEKAALYLESILRIIRQTSPKACSLENTLVTAALNLSDELLQLKNNALSPYREIGDRMEHLRQQMTEALDTVMSE